MAHSPSLTLTTFSGALIPYKIFGPPSPTAPLVLLSNPLLVTWAVWDPFLTAFFTHPSNKKYRLLCYLTRGRSSQYGNEEITLDVLADDIAALLDAVGVRKAKAVIGVSIGGATVLKFAIRYPERTEGMVCGSIFARSPEGGQRVWEERVAIAEGETVVDEAGERVVGGPLAELSVRRWFVKGSFDGGVMEERIEGIGRLVEGNSLGGFRALVHALYDFDMREEMVGCKVKGFLWWVVKMGFCRVRWRKWRVGLVVVRNMRLLME